MTSIYTLDDSAKVITGWWMAAGNVFWDDWLWKPSSLMIDFKFVSSYKTDKSWHCTYLGERDKSRDTMHMRNVVSLHLVSIIYYWYKVRVTHTPTCSQNSRRAVLAQYWQHLRIKYWKVSTNKGGPRDDNKLLFQKNIVNVNRLRVWKGNCPCMSINKCPVHRVWFENTEPLQIVAYCVFPDSTKQKNPWCQFAHILPY